MTKHYNMLVIGYWCLEFNDLGLTHFDALFNSVTLEFKYLS